MHDGAEHTGQESEWNTVIAYGSKIPGIAVYASILKIRKGPRREKKAWTGKTLDGFLQKY